MRFSVADLCAATGGELLRGRPDAQFDGAWFDSRTMPSGALFVPLRDVRDGHDFIEAAVTAGAAGYLTGRFETSPDVTDEAAFCVAVDDPAVALEGLARAARRRIGTVAAITGSAGKTTTKDFLAHVLATRYRTGASQGSFNNEIGIPLTLVNVPDGSEVVVSEIGARFAGNISAGCDIVRPNVGVVTIVGTAHLGIFGSRDAIAATKGELVAALDNDGCAVLNADDSRVAAMASRTSARIVRYGMDTADADVRAVGLAIDADLCATFTLVTPEGAAPVRLPVAGPHIVTCALGAAAAAFALGLGTDVIADALADAERSAHRMAFEHAAGGWRVVNDAYNASPEAMHAALASVRHLADASGGRALALIGHMAELGDEAADLHDEVGLAVDRLAFDVVVGVGPLGDRLARTACEDPLAGAATLRELAGGFRPGDVILVKASRVVGCERAVPELIKENP